MSEDTKIEDIELGTHDRCNILCCIMTLGMVPIEFVVGFGRLKMPINGFIHQHIIKRVEVGAARNMAVDYIMAIPKEDRPKWLFFLGDDMIPPWDGFIKLYEEAEKEKWDCLTGLYYIKGEPPTPLVWRRDHIGRMRPGIDFKVGDVVWVDMTGLDFTLIRVEVLERMIQEIPGLCFKSGPTIVSELPTGTKGVRSLNNVAVNTHTEDMWFYNKVQEVDGRIGVHTGVRVAHLDVRTGNIY